MFSVAVTFTPAPLLPERASKSSSSADEASSALSAASSRSLAFRALASRRAILCTRSSLSDGSFDGDPPEDWMCSMVVIAASSEMLREATSMTGTVMTGVSPEPVGMEIAWSPLDEIVSGVFIAPRLLRLITSGSSLHDLPYQRSIANDVSLSPSAAERAYRLPLSIEDVRDVLQASDQNQDSE